MLYSQFQSVGQMLSDQGLICAHSGNLSIRSGEKLCITKSGSDLSCLQEQDLVYTGIYEDDEHTSLASVELNVHRAIYQQTEAKAVVHAHPTYAVVLSFSERDIIPMDVEGIVTLTEVPVIGWETETVEPGGLADEIAEALKQRKLIVVRGHGCFAAAQSLAEACLFTTVVEQSSRIIYLMKMMGIKTESE
jgi:L-fuculose-phosphate aldolase